MLKSVLLLLLSVTGHALPQTLGPYSAAMNFTADMAGTPDLRPGTWGNAQAYPIRIPFHPPASYRVRILRVYGDFVAMPTTGVIQPGTYSEVSWGLLSTAPGGSSRVDLAADDCFLWNQTVLTARRDMQRMPFDYVVKDGGLLAADNILILQIAVSLNTTGLTIHLEPTLTAVYQFEKGI